MRLKLKENPREWQKFTASATVAFGLIAAALWKRHVLTQAAFYVVAGLLVSALLTCLVRPRWFRRIYRIGMTFGFAIGQVMGQVLLTLLFLLVLMPFALLLRLLGKQKLELRQDAHATTYWKIAKSNDHFDREF